MNLNIHNDSEFLKSVRRVCQIFGLSHSVQSIPYSPVELQLVVNDVAFLKDYGQSFFKISLIIGGDKSFKNLQSSVMRICVFFICMWCFQVR